MIDSFLLQFRQKKMPKNCCVAVFGQGFPIIYLWKIRYIQASDGLKKYGKERF